MTSLLWIKKLKLFFTSLLLSAVGAHATLPAKTLPHMDLELTGAEYRILLENQKHTLPFLLKEGEVTVQAHMFADIFATGKRNLDWIQVLNKNRSVPLSLTTPETQVGYPIDNPRIYNPKIIRDVYNQLQAEMPLELKKVIFGKDEFPTQLPVSDEEYIIWGLKVDRTYQIAARWKTMEPYMEQLKRISFTDIRGYYYLTTTPGFPEKLQDWNALSLEEQTLAKEWLLQACNNNVRNKQNCLTQTENAIQTNKALALFNQHRRAGKALMESMMFIPSNGTFSGARWSNADTFQIPFVDPSSEALRSFLTRNIETEWKILPFSLNINFVPSSDFGVEVIWQPGITPHVPALGDHRIYMDSNAPISEYDVQWTIRHEFGHVLGFPDCYVEFYDTTVQAIVGYQIDINDLMCSRRGHLKERHVSELKRVYN